ncbi:MAG: carbamoyltransferase [Candidatus Hydrogenedens sp.]|nr:carbamoyltransferase [Candidatus Hydrogenedens sp.]
MNILGIGGYSHDSAAALICGGEIVAAVAEERLTRVKHQGGVPREAVRFCLDQAGLKPGDIDHIGCYMRPGLRLAKRLPYRASQLWRAPLYSAAFMGYELLHNAEYARGMRSLCGAGTRLHYMHHHPAHAASSFLVSPFDRAAILSIDYVGEWDCTWMGVGEGTAIRTLQTEHYPHSLGVFYSALTEYLGFRRASDEYKVMGLASYGEPEYADFFRKLLRPEPGGRYRFDHAYTQWPYLPGSRCGYFSPRFIEALGPPRAKDEPVERRHENIAASAQLVLEEIALHLARWLRETTGARDLCLAGGVALNCSMNGRLLREAGFDRIYIQPAAGDDGIALGAALQLHHQYTGGPRLPEMTHAYLGPQHGDAAIEAALKTSGLACERVPDIEASAAELLAEGNIVGWYQGRMEWGPRALGSRSILADPTRPDMKDKLNRLVKFREEFRPFAPSVCEEDAPRYFEGCARSPFMLFVYPVKPEARGQLPAITHVDGTARVQTVREQDNPRYYRLLRAFEHRRGVPVLLNTSFNVMGEPIVNTPEDAVKCFQGSGIDALVMGDWLARKGG